MTNKLHNTGLALR